MADLVCAASMKAHRAEASSSACPGVELATALAAAANTAAGRVADAGGGDGGRGGSLETAVEGAPTPCCLLLAEGHDEEEEEEEEEEEDDHDDDVVHAEDEDEEDDDDVWRDRRTATPLEEPLGVAGGVTSVVVGVDVPGAALGLWLLPSAKSHRAARYSGRGSSGTVSRTS